MYKNVGWIDLQQILGITFKPVIELQGIAGEYFLMLK
jgi:hypothetical protein